MKPTAILVDTARGPIVSDRVLSGQAPLSPVNAEALADPRRAR